MQAAIFPTIAKMDGDLMSGGKNRFKASNHVFPKEEGV